MIHIGIGCSFQKVKILDIDFYYSQHVFQLLYKPSNFDALNIGFQIVKLLLVNCSGVGRIVSATLKFDMIRAICCGM